MPADLVVIDNKFVPLKPQQLPFKTNLPDNLQLLWAETYKPVKEARGWMPEGEWQRYLQGEELTRIVSDDELFVYEPRFGIAIDRGKRTTQTQMLYRASFVRLKDGVALWAKVEGVSLREKGFLRFGGEGRSASYEAIDPLPNFASYVPNLEKRFKVVLISPAWFSGGWQPKDGKWEAIFQKPVRLIAAAIPRPQKFGGFDVAKNEPKPIRNFVPAGSVYFFEADEPPQLSEDFAFTETPDEVRRQNSGRNAWTNIGLGKVLIGTW